MSSYPRVSKHHSRNSNPTASAAIIRDQTGHAKPQRFDDSRDSKNDSIFGARREIQRRRRHAPSCMGATEHQSNWPDMRKTLGKPGFCSGEDRNRTTYKFPGKIALRHYARREIRPAPISLFETTRNTIHRDQPAPSLQPDLQGHANNDTDRFQFGSSTCPPPATGGFRMDSGQRGSRCRGCRGTTGRTSYGTPTDKTRPRGPNRRHGTRGPSPHVGHSDR